MLSKNYYAIVVVYNCSYKDSTIYKSLKNQHDAEVIVCDNSIKDYGNCDFTAEIGCKYVNMQGNKGLPKAYNAAIDIIQDKNGVVCLFDDDTTVPEDYFKKLDMHFINSDYDIILPVVFDENGLLSPSIMRGDIIQKAKSLDELCDGKITGINSGMAIDLKVFVSYRYDDNLFLDFVDHAFIRDMTTAGKKIAIAKDIILNQKLSVNVYDKLSEIIRFKIAKNDIKYFYNEKLCSYLFVILKRRIKLCLKYKTLSFLFI